MFEYTELTIRAMYEGLSKAELAEVHALITANNMMQASILLTIMFGYLAAVYLVGRKLTLIQSIILTILYSALTLVFQLQSFFLSMTATVTQSMLVGEPPVFVFSHIGTGLALTLWIVSVVYMVQEQRLREA